MIISNKNLFKTNLSEIFLYLITEYYKALYKTY